MALIAISSTLIRWNKKSIWGGIHSTSRTGRIPDRLTACSVPSRSFSFSSFLLFLVEDLLCVAGCPEPEAAGAEVEEVLDPEDEATDSTLLPQRAQDRSCRRTGDTPSSTRKLT